MTIDNDPIGIYRICLLVLLPLLIGAGLCGCAGSGESAARPDIVYEMHHFEKMFGSCDTTGTPCVTITADYPKFASGGPGGIDDSINNTVTMFLLPQPDSGDRVPDLETYSQNTITQYRQLLAEFPDYTAPWFVSKEVIVLVDTFDVIALRSYESSYTGGAHPISFQFYVNFYIRTGTRLSLGDILIDSYLEPLTDTAEKIFRKLNDLPSTVNLGEAGFWFDHNRFTLNNNFAITDAGLIFYYNSYEIAPYAAGPTRILIPYGKIRHLIREAGPLASIK